MFAIDVCRLPVTGSSTAVVFTGLFMLIAGVIVIRRLRASAGRVSVVMVPLVLFGGLFLVPSTADSCLNPATDAPSLAVVEGLPVAPTPLLLNATVVAGGAVMVTIGGFAPIELVQLIVSSTPQVIGFATANSQGVVTLVGILPEGLTQGDHTLVVYAPVSGIGFTQEITVEPLNISTTLVATTTVPTTITSTTTVMSTTTIAATSTLAPDVYSVGNPGPSGGTIFYKDLNRPAGSQYFEVACAGWSDGTCGGNDLTDPTAVWGCSGTPILGADGTLIGTGEQNTIDIVNIAGGCMTTGIAARTADSLVLGGQDDWFLPSNDELNALCKWAFGDTVNTICNDNGRNSFSPTGVGGFLPSTYWSSSEHDDNHAWSPNFSNGYQYKSLKYGTSFVRPVRAF